MTTNPFENDDLRRMLFSYLRTPCEYKKPDHYECMKPYCVKIEHEETLYLNTLYWRLKTGYMRWFEDDLYTIGDAIEEGKMYFEDGDDDDDDDEIREEARKLFALDCYSQYDLFPTADYV